MEVFIRQEINIRVKRENDKDKFDWRFYLMATRDKNTTSQLDNIRHQDEYFVKEERRSMIRFFGQVGNGMCKSQSVSYGA